MAEDAEIVVHVPKGLIEALQYYADRENWDVRHNTDCPGKSTCQCWPAITEDGGYRAREALASWQKTAEATSEASGSKVLRRFWCGHEVPDSIPDDDMLPSWPSGMQVWLTGEGDGYTTWTALIEAEGAEAAEELIRSCYGPSADRIAMRWEPEEKPRDWEPPKDRFP